MAEVTQRVTIVFLKRGYQVGTYFRRKARLVLHLTGGTDGCEAANAVRIAMGDARGIYPQFVQGAVGCS